MSSRAQGLYGAVQLAGEFGITPRALRFYETKGLITPRRVGSRRVYDYRDRARLELILRGKRLGFSITEISEILDLYDAPDGEVGQLSHFVGKIRERRAALHEQAQDIQTVLDELDSVEHRCLELLRHADQQSASG